MTVTLPPAGSEPAELDEKTGTSRRRFLGFLVAGPTLVAASQIAVETANPTAAAAAVPTGPEPVTSTTSGSFRFSRPRRPAT